MSHKQSAVDLAKFVDKGVHVKLAGGREGDDRDAGTDAEGDVRTINL